MQHNGIFLPVYRASSYRLILLPPSSLRQRIGRFSATLARTCRLSPHAVAPPYVTLAQFSNYERSEEKLADRLRMIAMGYAPLRITLDGFGREAFHGVHIDTATSAAVQQLLRLLRADMTALLPGSKTVSIADHLRVPLAVNLTPASMSRCQDALAGKSFHGQFIADAMLLLKRSHQNDPWQVVERCSFLHLPVQIRQGELFS
jgi:hypothetical protein